jgi:hypothetical protein
MTYVYVIGAWVGTIFRPVLAGVDTLSKQGASQAQRGERSVISLRVVFPLVQAS